ncbi:MAG TPA: phage late control D family protein [Hyphomicrobiales bacterium]|nr:phage late control D family protein [Hyphomicrobiales bacterium]
MNAQAFIDTRPRLKVDGEENPDLAQALTAFVVNLPLSGMAHAELTVTNWVMNESGTMEHGFEALELGSEVEIVMQEEHSVFKGEVTAVEERYGEGAPQLVMLLQDKLHRLVRRRQSRAFEDTTVDAIVRELGSGLGLDVAVSVSSVTATYHQLNESDLAFLQRLIGPYDIAVRIDGSALRVKAEEADPEPVALDAGDSALHVRLIADLNHQYQKTTVKGFNVANGEAVSSDADTPLQPGNDTSAADVLGTLGWPGDETVPQPFARLQGEGDAFAKGHFNRGAKRFVSGEIRCQGEPALNSGREITLSGVSERFAGRYQIVHCVHRFDGDSGFETHLKLNKADWRA